jgi:hypothetical protein
LRGCFDVYSEGFGADAVFEVVEECGVFGG